MNENEKFKHEIILALRERDLGLEPPHGLAGRLIDAATAAGSARRAARNHWLAPLLVAAAVLVVILGGLVITHADRHSPAIIQPAPTVSHGVPDPSPHSSSTPSPSATSTTPARIAGPPNAAEIAAVMTRTYEVSRPIERFALTGPRVTVSDGQGGTFTAAGGRRTPSADGHGMLTFFWHDDRFVGWDSTEEAVTVDDITPAGTGRFEVSYDDLAANDPYCCPSLPRATLTFHWDGQSFVAATAIPPGVYDLNNAYARSVEVALVPTSEESLFGNGLRHWNASTLLITGGTLGGVKIGADAATAAREAGVSAFMSVGDGVLVPNGRPAGTSVYLYLGNFAGLPASYAGGAFSCVGAELTGTGTPSHVVQTTAGLRLGDPATRVRQIYGGAAVYVPQPSTGGLDPRAGYVVHQGVDDLVIKLDTTGSRVIGLAGGLAPMTPSECIG